ncbi:RING finger protein 32 isoform X4 [Hoplias malabaricus]|uniref:RING finger protein 32 isoform X4 n=1 Tax=Hoplias malabaricus TaxID=27720 RepID=UPI0034622F73
MQCPGFVKVAKGHSSSKVDGRKLAIAAVALQDHIAQTIPHLKSCSRTHPAASSRTHRARQHHKETGPEPVEYVLDPDPPPLTLAQKLGLVAAPERRLTAEDWMEVKSRSLREGDSTQPCVICTEEFRLQPQVLLSCSHVFHKVCLKSFEHFSGRKCCPVCRREPYETRVIHDGASLYLEKCAVRIQACWRGFVARKWYKDLRKLVPPNDPQLRRQFFEAKAVCRDVSDCPICLTSLHSSKAVLLLSCSHLFHEPCLRAFERYCSETTVTCPLCRRMYTSRPVGAHGLTTL